MTMMATEMVMVMARHGGSDDNNDNTQAHSSDDADSDVRHGRGWPWQHDNNVCTDTHA